MSLKKYLTKKLLRVFQKLKRLDERERIENLKKNPNLKVGDNVIFQDTSSIWFYNENKGEITIGDNSWICGELTSAESGGNLFVGSDTFIGVGTRIWSNKQVLIGNHVLISHNCNILDNDTHPINPEVRYRDWKNFRAGDYSPNSNYNAKPIIIEDDAWIGANVTVLKGVHIGKGAIVGTGSVVTKSVPDYAVVHGNPAIISKYVER
ncbi:MAG: acyltransferase [Acutalibacteraceae bacterium]